MRRLLLPLLILALAAFLRFRGLDFGLPLAESRPDEMTIAYQAMKFGRGDLNPHSFNYPSLFKYLVFVLFGGAYAVGKVTHHWAGQEDFLRSFFGADGIFRLLMRGLSATMGTVGVALLFRSPGGVTAALVLAVCFLHVRDSHFGVTDVTMVTLTTAAALAARRMLELSTVRSALLAGVLAGLATSTKYNAAVLGLPLILAARSPRLAAIAVGAMGVGFVAGTPFAVLDPRTFVHDFLYEATHLSQGQYVDVGTGWVHHLTHSLRYGMGIPVLAAGLLGLVVAIVRGGRAALVLYSFPVVYYILIGRGETAFFRYALPVVPFLCIAVGELLGQQRRGLILAAVLALPTAWSSWEASRLFAAGDTRDEMGAFIQKAVPTGSLIVHAGTYTGAPMLQRNVANQTREYEAKAGRADSAGFRKPDDMKWYQEKRPMYDVLFVRKEGIDFASQIDVDAVLANPPPWIEIEDYPLEHYASVPKAIRELVKEQYELAWTEKAYTSAAGAVFDQQDAFYMPVSGFGGFDRIGPTLRLYRLREP